ncbi:MAG: M56 family metallopeptidase [Lachnospiraceae bacterium]|nr:M56 family metallopeptidase [Lachnospiraceae bacterium]
MTWLMLFQFFNVCVMYLAVVLGHCVLISFPVLGIILLLRKLTGRDKCFLRGGLWSLMIPVLFAGRLRFFYETYLGVYLFWWQGLCIRYSLIAWIYLTGILVMAVVLLRRRLKLKRFVRGLKRVSVSGTDVYLCASAVSPFTTGMLRPRIVMPEKMFTELSEEEWQVVLLHEKVHIRLGHLWIYFFWDVLRMLCWWNPFLTLCGKYLRTDIEDICDRVTIQESGKQSGEYGKVLLKSIQILKKDNRQVGLSASLAGETGYRSIHRRFEKIARYAPYRKRGAMGLCAAIVCMVAVLVIGVKVYSYPRYTEFESVTVYNDTGRKLLVNDSPELRKAIVVEKDNIKISRQALDVILNENHVTEKRFFIGCGGFYKVPGIGGGVNAVFVDYAEGQGDLTIPYIDNGRDWMNRTLQYL